MWPLHCLQKLQTDKSAANKTCVQLPTYANNAALPAFAFHMLLLLSADHAAINRYLLPASKRAAACLLLWTHDRTDKQTDTVPLYRPCYAGSANK